MNWIREVRAVVATERTLLGIVGRPTLNDTYRMVDAHPELEVRWEVGIPTHLSLTPTGGIIYLCPHLDDDEKDRSLLEESGHLFLRHLSYRQPNVRDYLIGDGKHEGPAGAFSLLWRFGGVGGTDDDLLAEDYSPEDVTRFRELQLRG